MNYILNEKQDGIFELIIPTNTEYGTICFSWEKSNLQFMSALESKGIEAFAQLLADNPNNAFSLFCQ